MKKETREWIDAFKKAHYLKTDEEAIEKMIEIFTAWNVNVFKILEGKEKDLSEMLKCPICNLPFKKVGDYEYKPICQCLKKDLKLSVG